MNKISRVFQNAISLLATVFIPTRKAIVSVSSAVDPLSSDCIEVVRILQTADLEFPVLLVVHVDAEDNHINCTGRTVIVKKGSLLSIFYALTSRLSIVTHGFRDIGPFANLKTVVFNVWHGAPLKKIGYHSKAAFQPERLKNISRVWDYLVVPNPAWVTLFSEAFGLESNQILPIGFPRYNSVGLTRIRNVDGQPVKVAYLPTYRAGISSFAVYDFLRDPSFRRFLDVNKVELTVRFHPADRFIEEEISAALLCPRETTTEQMIMQCDLLVSDCSSVIIDAAAIGVATSIYFPDFAHIKEHIGGFYYDFPGESFCRGGVELSMQDIILEFLKNGAGNYNFPSELLPRSDFCSTFLKILPKVLEKKGSCFALVSTVSGRRPKENR